MFVRIIASVSVVAVASSVLVHGQEALKERPKDIKHESVLARSSDSYTVCEILAEDPTRLNGQKLQITGLLEGGDEGVWIDGECTSALTTYGVTWSNIIWLDFNPDNLRAQAAWRRMSEKLAKLHATIRDHIRVTILGKFKTRESMRDAVVTGPNGRPRKAGFGHMGTAPATMEVLDIRDVIVTKKTRMKQNARP